MVALFNQLLIALQTKILADIPDTIDVPGIRLVDQDLGQLDLPTRPAITSGGNLYLDFITTTYEQKQFKTQWGEMNILFRLAFDPFSKSSSLASPAIREKALAYFEIENKLYLSLQDWKANDLLMLPLKRLSAASEKREDSLRVRDIIFKATYQDLGLQDYPPLGDEQIINGTFNGNANGWFLGDGWSYDAGKVTFQNVSGAAPLYQPGILSTTKRYRASFDVVSNNGFVFCQFGNNKTAAVVGTNIIEGLWADVVGHGIKIYFMTSTDFDGSIKNVSIKQIIQ